MFLCITGGEALYADMGHIGRGADPLLLVRHRAAGATDQLRGPDGARSWSIPVAGGNPFLACAEVAGLSAGGAVDAATIIASQAIITGSFSLTRQAMQLGWMPGMNIHQTSSEQYGQIYVPVVNWLMMAVTLAITVAFKSRTGWPAPMAPRCPPPC